MSAATALVAPSIAGRSLPTQLYCVCGGMFYSNRKLLVGELDRARAEWEAAHCGRGHARCDRRTSLRAVRKLQRRRRLKLVEEEEEA